MLAARITLPHFSVSSAMSLPKSAGDPGSIVPPSSTRRGFTLASSRAGVPSFFGFFTISARGALRLDELAEVGGRSRNYRPAQLDEAGLHLGVIEGCVDLLVELLNNLSRRVLRRTEAGQTTGLETGHKVTHRGNVREPLPACSGRHRQGAQLASPDVADRRCHVVEHDLDPVR